MKKVVLMASVSFFLAGMLPANSTSAPRWVSFSAGGVARVIKSEEISRPRPVKSTADAFTLEITLPGFLLAEQEMADGMTYSRIIAPGAGSHEVGRPDLPVFGTALLIPNGTIPVIEVTPGKPHVFKEIEVAPLQPPPPDGERPPFTKDTDVYGKDADFPGEFALLEPVAKIRGQESSILWLYPYRYNPARKRLHVYPDLRVTVRFEGTRRRVPSRLQSRTFSRLLGRIALNADAVLPAGEEAEAGQTSPTGGGGTRGTGAAGACDYLIIAHPDFSEAAETLAAWKRKAGFLTYATTTSETGSTSAEILAYLQDAYDTWDPAPTYVLFIGDAEYVPTNYRTVHPYSGDLIGTDLYYATLDGSDYFPDIITGRLSVDTVEEAMKRVNDIIGYETDPVTDSSFYATAAICAYFQHAGGGYAERRFAQTSEDLAIFLSDPAYLGDYSVERFYYTGSTVTPLYWSLNWFGGGPAGDPGDPIPSYLEKPGFAWDASAADISAAVNSGRFLITHRDHGSATGWGSPGYTVSNVEALTNGNKLPVVWSINCLTGFFDKETCQSPSSAISFSEAWERNTGGGAAGVLAATRVSYSGHNDRLFWGWTDAIWPDFVGSFAGAEPAYYRMGDVLNYGKLYYSTTYSASTTRKVEFEIFHWYGDPAMMIRTQVPETLSVSHPVLVPRGAPLDFEVIVESGGIPLEGATVTVSRSDAPDDYRVETTDGTGTAVFADLVTNETGDYDLVVTAPNTVPYQGTFMSMVGSAGYIDLDDTAYSCSDEIEIAVYDLDRAGIGSQAVTVSSSGGDAEAVLLTESPADSGVFAGRLVTDSSSPSPGDAELQLADGELITALYNDEDDGTGNPASVEDTAAADCAPPDFAGLDTATGAAGSVILTWNGASDPNGPVTYAVYRDQSSGLPVGNEIAATGLLTYTDNDLEASRVYFYTVRARDRLGNEDGNTVEMSGSAYLAVIPFSDGFEGGALGPAWTVTTTAEGRVRVAAGYPAAGSYSLLLDDSVSGSEYSIAAAILSLDLSGKSDVVLAFQWREFGDESHPEDGVFISDDSGGNWHQVLSFNGGTSSYASESIDLDTEVQDAGLTYNNRSQIKFQFYDNYPIASDGYSIDSVTLQTSLPPPPTPSPTPTVSPTVTPSPSPVPQPTSVYLVVGWDDYNGDGYTDYALFRDGTWNIMGAQSGTVITEGVVWGDQVGDIPAPGDYDGDGTADIAYYNRFSARWHV
ncbi:MAG: C25 family cysteine peptidase, partial [PVC group bacterium]